MSIKTKFYCLHQDINIYLRYVEYVRSVNEYGSVIISVSNSNAHGDRKVLKEKQ